MAAVPLAEVSDTYAHVYEWSLFGDEPSGLPAGDVKWEGAGFEGLDGA